MKWTQDEIFEACKIVAPKFNLNPVVVLAFAKQEAKKDGKYFLADVAKPEPRFYTTYIVPMNLSTSTEVLLAASYGVFQSMGQVLRELGFFDADFANQSSEYQSRYISSMSQENVPKAIDRFCVDLQYQVEYACIKIRKLIDKYGSDMRKVALMYNGGGRPEYADEWGANLKQAQAECKL